MFDDPRHQLLNALTAHERECLQVALDALNRNLRCPGAAPSSPAMVHDFLRLRLAHRPYEAFTVMFLNWRNEVIDTRELFTGTTTQTAVYPREIARAAVLANATSVILAHNHPSGVAEPSPADIVLTNAVVTALALLDIRVLDHVIVGRDGCTSFAQRGIL